MGRTLRLKKNVVANMVGAELFLDKQRLYYEFDGATMYATIPDWTPNGLPFEVSVEAVPLTVDGTVKMVVHGTSGNHYISQHSANLGRYRSEGNAAPISIIDNASISEGKPVDWVMNAAPDGTQFENVSSGDSVDVSIASPLAYVAANNVGAQPFHGPIWNLRLTDNSPIQDTDACFGDANRYVQLQAPIVLAGDFEIEFDWIRQDGTGTGTVWLFGAEGSTASIISVYDSGHAATANRLNVRAGGEDYIFDNALSDVALGQHFNVRVVRSGGQAELFVDAASKGTVAASNGTMTIDQICAGNTSNQLPTNSALQNIRIRDLTEGRSWEYKLDEGAGTDAPNTDPSTQGNYLNQPLWDRYTLDGDGARYVEIPEFNIGDSEDCRVTLDIIRPSANGMMVCGDASGGGLLWQFSDELQFGQSGGSAISMDISSVATGQHFSAKFERISNVTSAYLNGEYQNQIGNLTGAMNFFQLMAREGAVVLPDGAIANVILENLTTGEYVEYRIDEGSGTVVKAYSKGGAELSALNGTVTPDAAWTLQPEYSNDGQWTPDVDWQFIPRNDRHYPLNSRWISDTGVITDIIGGQDGQIVNYDAGALKPLP